MPLSEATVFSSSCNLEVSEDWVIGVVVIDMVGCVGVVDVEGVFCVMEMWVMRSLRGCLNEVSGRSATNLLLFTCGL